jgi:hypothetical protein
VVHRRHGVVVVVVVLTRRQALLVARAGVVLHSQHLAGVMGERLHGGGGEKRE